MVEHIKAARRAGNVHRFHTVRTLVAEDVAKHSFNCYNILMWLTGGKASRSLIIHTLAHDMGEYGVGDIPSPVKRYMGLEALSVIGSMERTACREVAPWAQHQDLDDREEGILKLVDNLDGYLKCAEEVEMGNADMLPVMERYVEYIYNFHPKEIYDEFHTVIDQIIGDATYVKSE